MDQAPAIGIDLGTTYSCVGFYDKNIGKVIIIQNEIGNNTTPSCIAFEEDGDVIVGRVAKTSTAVDPLYTVYDIKRLIGRRFDDPLLQNDIKLWPFKVIGEDNVPKLVLWEKTYHPEQISAKVLGHMKKIAEDYLRLPVTRAVITVPAYFNDGQRQATKDAGAIAGLEVLRILNEPTASAIAYCHQEETTVNCKNVLIFDLGGGTLDIAVLTIEGQHIVIKAVGGDTHLGGEDFDNSLADYCIQEFERTHSINLASGKHSLNSDVKIKTARNLKRLKNQCEEAKINLTAAKRTMVSLDAAWGDVDLCVKISRETFSSLNEHHFKKCISIMEQVLQDSSLQKSSVDEIILVGGSSRIPKLQDMISTYFVGKKLNKRINQDEAVAYGAAVQAALMTYTEESLAESNQSMNITIKDVIPLPIGIEAYKKGTKEKYLNIILKKNTPVPCTASQMFVTANERHQTVISIYEGENPIAHENHFLGSFKTKNLPPSCKKGEHVKITMSVNEEGILTVTASYGSSDKTDEITVDESKGRLTLEQVTSFLQKETTKHD